jgi:hypothetical protein
MVYLLNGKRAQHWSIVQASGRKREKMNFAEDIDESNAFIEEIISFIT